MPPRTSMVRPGIQPYKRIAGEYLADPANFPKLSPPLSKAEVLGAIRSATRKCGMNKKGLIKKIATGKTPADICQYALDHILGWTDPIDGICLLTSCKGIRLYGSVKKHIRTVGGQDIRSAVQRLEKQAHQAQDLTCPYLCAYMIANPVPGKTTYEESRFTGRNRDGDPHSPNAEIWGPEFIFLYISGHKPWTIFKSAWDVWGKERPYYTLKHRRETTRLLVAKLNQLGLVGKDGKLDADALLKAIGKTDKLEEYAPEAVENGGQDES